MNDEAIILWGGIIIGLLAVVLASAIVRLWWRAKLATAWDYGYATRSYDEVTDMVSPNPYSTGEYPVPDPVRCTLECADERHDLNLLTDRQSEILTKVAAGLQGEPHPLTGHDHARLGDLAYQVNTRDKCWDTIGPSPAPCILMDDHRGQHRDEFGNTWHNLAGFHPAARKDNAR